MSGDFVGPVQPGSFTDILDQNNVSVRAPFLQTPEGFAAAAEAFGSPEAALRRYNAPVPVQPRQTAAPAPTFVATGQNAGAKPVAWQEWGWVPLVAAAGVALLVVMR